MTLYEIRIALALGACTFPPAHPHKRFCRDMAWVGEHSPDRELSLRQRHYMELMAWRYRRQLDEEFVPLSKPLNLPPKAKIRKPKKGKKHEDDAHLCTARNSPRLL